MASHHSYKAKVTELKETSEVEIESSIGAEEFSQAIADTLSELKKDVTLPGFRKGAAPEKMVREKIGDAVLLSEAAENAIRHAYMHILQDEKIDAIGHPKVSITKIAEGNDLEFKIVTAVVPKVESFDYKSIASAENAKPIDAVIVTDEELKKEQEKMPDLKKEDLVNAKEYRAKEKKRLELVDALTKGMKVIVPQVLIESELSNMISQMKGDIERMGLSFPDYLKHLKKSEDDLKNEWRADAEKRVKLDLAIAHIATAEKISPDKEKIEAEIKHVKEHHKDVDEARARSYFSHIFLNQAVFEFLEKQK